ncbi:MAG TPA: ATPase, T2SS/T4P/T4SS family, partial [Candidatus Woesebacteria bacterium]|nr:ATPase, T2SS/T4P/T4SS family [Candidatus Woesebacteria bacterium]
MFADAQLEKILLDSKKLSSVDLDQVKKLAVESKISLRDAVIKAEKLSDEEIGALEAEVLQVPHVVLTKISISPELIKIVPEHVAQKQLVVAFARSDKELKVATANPQNKRVMEAIAKKTGLPVSIHYSTVQDITNVISIYTKDLQKKFEKLLEAGLGTTKTESEAYDPPIEKIVNLLITSAYEDKASDIHIEPKENELLVRFRVDGILFDSLSIPIKLHDRIVTRIKVLSSLRTDEHMSAQDGKMQISLKEENLNLRVSILPVAEGEKVVLRLLSSKSRSYTLVDLGMNEKDLAKLTKAFNKPNGMI